MNATPDAALDKLVRMANQIALAFRLQQPDEAVTGVANHIRSFWTPKMRRDIAARIDRDAADVDPVAKKAIEKLRAGEKVGAQMTSSNIKKGGEDG